MRKYTKALNWKDIEGLTIKETEPLNSYETDVKITFTDESEVFIKGGNCGGEDCMWIEKEVEFLEIPKYYDLYTIKEFLKLCKRGVITNNDGNGFYALEGKWSRDLRVYPETIFKMPITVLYTHVIWFNRYPSDK